MEDVYPQGPANVRSDLTRPSSAYKRHAYLAVAGVLVFLAAYAALTGWFAWTAYRLLSAISRAPDQAVVLIIGGVAAAFLAILMLKAVIFVRRGQHEGDLEVTQKDYPRLFAFLHRLADEAKAPRPHRVFLSPRVNASVFYDLSIMNLVLASRKNLEIGLGLINVLTLAEVKAVLAHEFGHFAQRTMAVGRWIYIAQQIAGHLVAKRDGLDRALRWISNFDLRVAWIGWILRLIVWSIRSLIESVFRWVVLAERALSREMELQADLVAVSLTGSDALVHGLHRLAAADDAMDRAISFAGSQQRAGKAIADLFAIQSDMLQRTRTILDDPSYGQVPALPAKPETHRLFKAQLAQPPRMWSTHPANDVREENAKREYIAAPLDDRSAWVLFEDPARIRADVTARLYEQFAKADDKPDKKPLETPPIEESLKALAAGFERRFFDAAYRGAYLGRSVVRDAETVAALYGPAPSDVGGALATLYPETLPGDLERVRELSQEKAMLRALERGILQAPGGIVRYRGRDHHRRDLPHLIAKVEGELATARQTVADHDKRVRAAHLAAARQLSPAWEAYLKGLASILHYADHREADLEDAMGSLENVVGIVLADRKVTNSEIERLVLEARDIYTALIDVNAEAKEVDLGALAGKLEVESWREMLGEEFDLPPPAPEHMGDWLNVIHSWVAAACGALSAVSNAALDELLRVEHEVAEHVKVGTTPGEAPTPPRIPPRYMTLCTGKERPRQLELGWWDRFQVADGFVPGAARFLCAGAIVGLVVFAGRSVGGATVHVVNGLDRPVIVTLDGRELRVAPRRHETVEVDSGETYTIRAKTVEGELIESFEGEVSDAFGHYVYDVARAAPLLEFDPDTRAEKVLGAPRWLSTSANQVFDDPDHVYVRAGDPPVIASFATQPPQGQVAESISGKDGMAIAAAHVRWDAPRSPNLETWLSIAMNQPAFGLLLDARIQAYPDDISARRFEQERGPRAEVCARHTAMAAERRDASGWQYLATRCIDDPAARNDAFAALAAQRPDEPWIRYAEACVFADRGEYEAASALLDKLHHQLPENRAAIAMLRVRVAHVAGHAIPDELFEQEVTLSIARTIERGDGEMRGELAAYRHLYLGELSEAVAKATGTSGEPIVHLLAACSQGATQAELDKGAAVGPDRAAGELALYAYALAIKMGRDPAPYVKDVSPHDKPAFEFIDAVRTAKSPTSVTPPIDFTRRAHAFAAAAMLLGDKTPPEWRKFARLVLFPFERPYLGP